MIDIGSDLGWRIAEWLSPLVVTAATWALGMLGKWIASKAKSEALKSVIFQVQGVAETTVREVQQTMVDALKKAREDGKLTPEEKEQILKVALSSAKRSLGSQGRKRLQATMGLLEGELDGYLTAFLEAAVHSMKDR